MAKKKKLIPVDSPPGKLLDVPEIRSKFLATIGQGLSVLAACKRADINPSTYYRYIEDNPDLLDEIDDKKQEYIDSWVEIIQEGRKLKDYRFALEVLKTLPTEYSNRVDINIKNNPTIKDVYDRIDEKRKKLRLRESRNEQTGPQSQ